MSLENLSEEELQDIVENITEEEFDQLDELSKKTLLNYAQEAGRSANTAYANKEMHDTSSKSWKSGSEKFGVDSATKRFYRKISKQEKKFSDKEGNNIRKRGKGLQMVGKKLTREEFDQLDELSKKTLGNYIRASADSHANSYLDSEAADTYGDDWEEHEHKAKNRLKGINRAIKRFPGKEKTGNKILKNTKRLVGNKTSLFHDRDGPSNTDEPYHYNHTAERDYEDYDTEHTRRKIDKNVSKLTREDISDLISTAIDKRPINFAEKFNDILVDKIEEAIEYKKYQVAESLYGTPDDYNKLYLEDIDIDLDLEEFDQLDELSKKTLGNYIRASADAHANHSLDGEAADTYGDDWEEHEHKEKNRLKGIKSALKRFPGKEKIGNKILKNTKGLSRNKSDLFHDRDGPSNTNEPYHYNHTAERDYENYDTEHSRRKIDKNVSKLTREEFDQLDELSKKTLGSYIKKAATDMSQHHAKTITARQDYDSAAAIDHSTSGTPSDVRDKAKRIIRDDANNRENSARRKSSKRYRGIDKATSKLTREEFDLQELARETMTSDLIKKGHKESDLKKMKYSEVRDHYMNHDYNNSK